MILFRKPHHLSAFTLIELLVGMAILTMLMAVLFSVVNQTSTVVRKTHSKVDEFQKARSAMDIMTRTLSQTTLNAYWDYYDAKDTRRTIENATWFKPEKYGRASDLHFLINPSSQYGQEIYFQSPLTITQDDKKTQTEGLLNSCGYFISFEGDSTYRPGFISKNQKFRYRLMQSIQPTEKMIVYIDPLSKWIGDVRNYAWPIADNIIALIIWPRLSVTEDPTGKSISDNYLYDSRNGPKNQRHQLPPALQITLIAIDEASAVRITQNSGEPNEISQTMSGRFIDPSYHQEDLDKVSKSLTKKHIHFEIFSSVIPIHESKWSPE